MLRRCVGDNDEECGIGWIVTDVENDTPDLLFLVDDEIEEFKELASSSVALDDVSSDSNDEPEATRTRPGGVASSCLLSCSSLINLSISATIAFCT